MIGKNTVLVLGAGASAPFGFPTGRKLLLNACNELDRDTSFLTLELTRRGISRVESLHFRNDLETSMQPSIDAFVEGRPEYLLHGKVTIASLLIPCENIEIIIRRGKEISWYEYLFSQIGPTLNDFHKSKISFVTFNYDRSLEYFLYHVFQSSFGIDNTQASQLINSKQIVHVYGMLGNPHFLSSHGRDYDPEASEEAVSISIEGITILSEKSPPSATFATANALIKSADIVCFLGFGYHPINMSRLGIDILDSGPKLLGTAYGLLAHERHKVFDRMSMPIEIGTEYERNIEFIRQHPVFN
jgi:hypothetical protein